MGNSDEEDDYMSMFIAEPTKPQQETSIQRRARKEREAEIRGRVKSKAEKQADEAAAREAALAKSLDSSNKGFKMMEKLGFKPGDTLGATKHARAEPIHLVIKEDRGGIGLDTEKKRKFREQVEHEAKRVKADEGEYRERIRLEREEKRREGQILNAQKVAERLDNEAKDVAVLGEVSNTEPEAQGKSSDTQRASEPSQSINVLWRGLVRRRLEKERERRMRYDLTQSLSRLPTYEDPDEDENYRLALGKENKWSSLEEELEEEDPELDEFNGLPSDQRLGRLVLYMRDTHHYCFWCKYQYPDGSMDGCPGTTEDDHD
ncbi:G-patch-domain-containing protein [Lepidopterella palustris CBS 459.81]|uniref:G-patch-domain-containing protein n=1 Tax=Lepidopterella palustris CBS 459.81 TaxID=1314670 RepID=A0A8E2EBM9_9PEZI|nr:G-patch-domain-containing protein [Lepidopterella palustris CBS 459.81]